MIFFLMYLCFSIYFYGFIFEKHFIYDIINIIFFFNLYQLYNYLCNKNIHGINKKKITKIHGKYYDLTDFKHPGGDTAIFHAINRDSTVLFESHHPFISQNKLQNILKKYEISNDIENNIEDCPYNFKFDTEFSKELKQEVYNYFLNISDNKNTSISYKSSYAYYFMIFLQYMLSIYFIKQYINGIWYSIITLPLIFWLNGRIFHEASHFALSENPVINDIFCSISPYLTNSIMWKIQHNIGHHAYTNIYNKDPDLKHNNNLYRVHPNAKTRKSHKNQENFIYFIWLLGSGFGMRIENPLQALIKNNYNKSVSYKFSNQQKMLIFVEHLFYIYFIHIYPILYIGPIYKGILFSIIPSLIYSVCFMINSQITHLHEECINIESDWYKHQINTSTNHGIGKSLNFYFSGGLNYQIEHHLFPTINHEHLIKLQPIIKNLCIKHNINYKEFSGYREAFTNYYNHIKKLGYHN